MAIALTGTLAMPAGAYTEETQSGDGVAVQEMSETAIDDTDAVSDKVAGASEMTEVVDVVEEGMTPVYPDELKPGSYDIEMSSSSSMFKADHVVLTVEDNSMYVSLYMTSEAYLYMYDGTAQEAAGADEADYITLTDTDEDMPAFVLPLEALDDGFPYAAFSKRKQKWYDRTLLFRADSLPMEAYKELPMTTLDALGLEDGEYTVEVELEGGSGRASVESPALITVKDGECTAEIIWSSSNYDFMVVDDVQYELVNTEGNSTFEIPVAGFDCAVPVQADTTAMSQPYLIDYTLYYDSATIAPAS